MKFLPRRAVHVALKMIRSFHGSLLSALIISAISLSVLGCATPIEFTPSSALPANEGLVRGRIAVVRGGRVVVWNFTWTAHEAMQVYLLTEDDRLFTRYVLRGDGHFCWHLPPGRYVIAAFELQRAVPMGNEFSAGRIWAEFAVPSAGSRTDLGTLVIQLSSRRYGVNVFDESQLDSKAQSATDVWKTALMVLDPMK